MCKNAAQVGKKAAELVVEQIKQKPNSVLGLSADPSFVLAYAALAADRTLHNTDWSQVTTFNLGEYAGVRGTDFYSRRHFMDANLFTKTNIDQDNTHVPSGIANLDEEPDRYIGLITAAGGIDLQLLDLGEHGSVGFNYPGGVVEESMSLVDIPDQALAYVAGQFPQTDVLPRKALAVGLKFIAAARKIVIVATGEHRSEALRELLQGDPEGARPSSLFRQHQNAVVLADKPAARLLKLKWHERWSKRVTYDF